MLTSIGELSIGYMSIGISISSSLCLDHDSHPIATTLVFITLSVQECLLNEKHDKHEQSKNTVLAGVLFQYFFEFLIFANIIEVFVCEAGPEDHSVVVGL